MVIVDKVIVASDVVEEAFFCDLDRCKGACCVEGDLGAPIEAGELGIFLEAVEPTKEFLDENSLNIIESQGAYSPSDDGGGEVMTAGGRECIFAIKDNRGILKCGFEHAWKEGKSSFQKPISCHLYPIRISKLVGHEALNYERWSICGPACELGSRLSIPVYKFLQGALERRYGKDWFNKLEKTISEDKS